MSVLIFFANFSEIFIILTRIERDIIINMFWSSCKVFVILVRFKLNLCFLEKVSKNRHILKFTKIRPMFADSFPCGQVGG